MSAGHQQPASTWTEPPWSGWIETTGDALLILEAARRGLIPRVTRRLVDSERKMITSGSVFVFDEDESGIKRWTDGFFWSPSRILGNFLLYRETDKRGTGHRGGRAQDGGSPDNESPQSPEAARQDTQSLSRPKMDGTHLGLDKLRERSLMGSLTNSYKFKSDGLMKKTFSLNIGGVAQHLISYYRIEDVENGRLRSPSSLPELASLDISPEYLDKTHFRNPPKVEVGPDGIPRYRGEADDVETSTSLITAPLSSGLPLLTDGRVTEGSKRAKRFDPYGAPSSTKRPRKHGKTTPEASGSSDQLPAQQSTSASPTAIMQPPQVFPDPNAPHPQHSQPYPPYGGYYPMPGYGMPPPPPPPPHAYSPPYPTPAPPPTSGSPVPTPTAPAPVAGPSQPQTHPHPPPQHPSPPIGTPPVPAGAPMPIPYPYPGYPNPGVPPGASDSAAPAPPYYGYYHAPPGAYYPPWAAAPPYGPAYAHPHAPPQPPMPAGVIEGVGAEKSGQEGEGNGEEEES